MEQIKGPDKKKQIEIECSACGSVYSLYKAELKNGIGGFYLGEHGMEFVVGIGISCQECGSWMTYKGER